MSRMVLDFTGVDSSRQSLSVDAKSFDGIYDDSFSFSLRNIPDIEASLFESVSLTYTPENSLGEQITDIDGEEYPLCSLSLSNTDTVPILNGVKSSIQTVIVTGNTYVYEPTLDASFFMPQDVFDGNRKVFVSKGNSDEIISNKAYKYKIAKTGYSGIFTDAVRIVEVRASYPITLTLYGGETGTQISRGLSGEIFDLSHEKINIFWKYSDIFDMAVGLYASHKKNAFGPIFDSEFSASSVAQEDPVMVDLDEYYSGGLKIESLFAFPSIFSTEQVLAVPLVDIDSSYYALSEKLYKYSFGETHSAKLNILRLVSGAIYARVISVEASTYTLHSVNTKVYKKKEMNTFSEGVYPLVDIVSTQDFDGMELWSLNIQTVVAEEINLDSMTQVAVSLSVIYEEQERLDFEAMYSARINILSGPKDLINDTGLYHDVFIDATPYLPHENTAWTPSESNMFRIGRGGSDSSIRFDLRWDAYRLQATNYSLMNIDFINRRLENETWMFPGFKRHPYIRLLDEDTGNFIIIATHPNGGSIIHMKDGNGIASAINDTPYSPDEATGEAILPVDFTKAEAAAIVVGSDRYQRFAMILKEKSEGVMWDDSYVDDALSYMIDNVSSTEFFIGAPYSPVVLRSIILDKMRGKVDSTVFHKVTERYYSVVPYLYDPDEDRNGSPMNVDFISDSSDAKISRTAAKIHKSNGNIRVSRFGTGPIVATCNIKESCNNIGVSRYSSVGVIHLGEPSVRTSGFYRHGHLYLRREAPAVFTGGDIVDLESIYSMTEFRLTRKNRFEGILSGPIRIQNVPTEDLSPVEVSFKFSKGLPSLGEVLSSNINVKVGVYNFTLPEVFSDFKFNITSKTFSRDFDSVESPKFRFSTNTKGSNFDGVDNGGNAIVWIKIFPPRYSGRSMIQSNILDFNITDREFATGFSFPYDFLNPEALTNSRASKSRSDGIKEKKIKEIPDILPGEYSAPKKTDLVCGNLRERTYIEFQNHDHMFDENDGQFFGKMSWDERKTIMSAYLRIQQNSVIREGVKLSDADSLRKTMAEIKLSAIDDLSKVENWNIEEFTIDSSDFGSQAVAAESLSSIDEVFRNAMRSVLDTIGSDSSVRERRAGKNIFPAYPDRMVIGDELSTTVKPKQYIIIEEK